MDGNVGCEGCGLGRGRVLLAVLTILNSWKEVVRLGKEVGKCCPVDD